VETKPVTPEHEDASADPDVAALAAAVDGAVIAADRFAGGRHGDGPADKIVDICRASRPGAGSSSWST